MPVRELLDFEKSEIVDEIFIFHHEGNALVLSKLMKNENIATRMVFHINEFSYRHYSLDSPFKTIHESNSKNNLIISCKISAFIFKNFIGRKVIANFGFYQ